jgi:hypothetical protein
MKRFRFELPDVDDSYALADWVEVMMLLSRRPEISRAQLSEALVAQIGSTPQELEAPINLLFAEVGRRRRIAGQAYPFAIENTVIRLSVEADSEFYKFLLLISLDGPMRRDKRYKEIDEIFDKVVCEAAKGYFGEGTETARFGWPPSDGRPSNFHRALEWLSVKTGIPVGSGIAAPSTKDGGLDVVVWKPFADNRTAFVVAFIQCTVQSNWFPKGKDIIDNLWRARIDTAGSALTSLAVPFVIHKNFPKWDDLRRTVNIVFDRLRLAQALANRDSGPFEKMIRWNEKEIARFAV